MEKNRENGVLLSLFLALKKNKIHGFSNRQRSCKTINADKYGVLGTFPADEGAKISTLNKVYDRINI
jgi:hypothetical protein